MNEPDPDGIESARHSREAEARSAAAADEILAMDSVDAVVILVSLRTPDGCTSFSRQQRGNLHACEGLVREKVREMQSYEDGYHYERGRYDAVTNRQASQERQRKRNREGDEWKDGES